MELLYWGIIILYKQSFQMLNFKFSKKINNLKSKIKIWIFAQENLGLRSTNPITGRIFVILSLIRKLSKLEN